MENWGGKPKNQSDKKSPNLVGDWGEKLEDCWWYMAHSYEAQGLAELEDDVEYTSLSKLTKLMKKPSNLIRISKEKTENALNFLALGGILKKSN